ncbi:hypothetical protein [Helicobacter sp. MIT 14-3879]|uniref:hypothetical protein n=1 Tax=Helicobacter sp. MIT 14-3879 TaxID=2040649 RepID=UPI000E1EF906|nr:hypothetical protein [Helicobacter sp. MIT 14-3879]RDU59420.1 hypothetical protein CQA44_11455 [Helicobacter sp. MIT 14-3879]
MVKILKNGIIALLFAQPIFADFDELWNPSCNTRIQLLKEYGFAFCLEKGYEDPKQSFEKQPSFMRHLGFIRGGSIELSMLGREKFEELEKYILTYLSNPKNIPITKHQSKLYVLACLRLYDSPKYQDEVKRIVKKYCKDCK